MNFFTLEWYKELQVYAFLSFPESKEEWEALLEDYRVSGLDYRQSFLERMELIKIDLLTHLPEPFHASIQDGTLCTEYPSKELLQLAEQWCHGHLQRSDKRRQAYLTHYESIKDMLPSQLIRLHEKSLYDGKVRRIDVSTPGQLVMLVDCTRTINYAAMVLLTFTGVEEVVLPKRWEGAWWHWQEVHLTDSGFALHILFDSPLAEGKIVANDVLIEVLEELEEREI